MSDKLFLLIAGGCCSILSIAPMFVELPFFVMLALASAPLVAVIPMLKKRTDPLHTPTHRLLASQRRRQ